MIKNRLSLYIQLFLFSIFTIVAIPVDAQTIRSFTTTDTVVVAGSNATLSWDSENAAGCTATGGLGFSGSIAVDGSATVGPIDAETTFLLTCFDYEWVEDGSPGTPGCGLSSGIPECDFDFSDLSTYVPQSSYVCSSIGSLHRCGVPSGDPCDDTFTEIQYTVARFVCSGGGSVSDSITIRLTECSDGINNDTEDSLIDLEDPGCDNAADDDETHVPDTPPVDPPDDPPPSDPPPSDPPPAPVPDPVPPTPTPDPSPPGPQIVPICEGDQLCGYCDLLTLAENIVRYLLMFLVLVAVLMIMYGGLLYLTAAGDSGQLQKARRVFVWVVAGFIMVLVAWFVIDILVTGLLSDDLRADLGGSWGGLPGCNGIPL